MNTHWSLLVCGPRGRLQLSSELSVTNQFQWERTYSPELVAAVAGRTSKHMGSGWLNEEGDAGDTAVVLSGGSTLFPINDLARSRHCSASLSIRSTSNDTLSLSSVARTERETVRRNVVSRSLTKCTHKKTHQMVFDIGFIFW